MSVTCVGENGEYDKDSRIVLSTTDFLNKTLIAKRDAVTADVIIVDGISRCDLQSNVFIGLRQRMLNSGHEVPKLLMLLSSKELKSPFEVSVLSFEEHPTVEYVTTTPGNILNKVVAKIKEKHNEEPEHFWRFDKYLVYCPTNNDAISVRNRLKPPALGLMPIIITSTMSLSEIEKAIYTTDSEKTHRVDNYRRD